MEARGRYRKNPYLEKDILKVLKESENGVGFTTLFLKLKPGSKSTLSSTLNFLILHKKIEKISTGKYTMTATYKSLSNIDGLKKLLYQMGDLISNLKTKQHAYIGIKLWTVIFQREFHPVEMFIDDSPYFRISNNASRSARKKAFKEFLELRKYPSIFEEDMTNLFFEFCGKFSTAVLDYAFNKIFDSETNTLTSKNKNPKLVNSFRKEIFVRHFPTTTYYGIEFYKILLEERPDVCNEDTLQKLKKKHIFEEIGIME